jgi:hypothetical protein
MNQDHTVVALSQPCARCSIVNINSLSQSSGTNRSFVCYEMGSVQIEGICSQGGDGSSLIKAQDAIGEAAQAGEHARMFR